MDGKITEINATYSAAAFHRPSFGAFEAQARDERTRFIKCQSTILLTLIFAEACIALVHNVQAHSQVRDKHHSTTESTATNRHTATFVAVQHAHIFV